MPMPHDGFFNTTTVNGLTYLPRLGYPMRPSAIVGLNDTLQLNIQFYNRTDKPYIVRDIKPEEWFKPAVFDITANIFEANPFLDDKQLSYRVRGWYHSWTGKRIPAPDTLAPHSEIYGLDIDVWGVPQGFWWLIALPTDSVPEDFYARTEGSIYEYREAVDIRDTVNALEACYHRALYDDNLEAAMAWTDSILKYNPESVPGWWLKACTFHDLGKKEDANAAYDSAIYNLDKNLDRALPDSTKRSLHEAEKQWLRRAHGWLHRERGQ